MPVFEIWRRATVGALVGCLGLGQAQTLWLEPTALKHAPQVVGGADQRLLLGPGDEMEVRGPNTERLLPGERYPLVSGRASATQWVQPVAHARTVRVQPGALSATAWLRIEEASDAVHIGDRVWWWPIAPRVP